MCMKKQELAGSQTSTEETDIRVQEDTLFNHLKAPPKLLEGVMDLLGDDKKPDNLVEQRLNQKKRERKRDDDRTSILKSALSPSRTEKPQKKPRKEGRPNSELPYWKRPGVVKDA